jgi:hypothetical protein
MPAQLQQKSHEADTPPSDASRPSWLWHSFLKKRFGMLGSQSDRLLAMINRSLPNTSGFVKHGLSGPLPA